jgi:hypothetical protein
MCVKAAIKRDVIKRGRCQLVHDFLCRCQRVAVSCGELASENHICYIYFMSGVRINKSALKHGISDIDIRLALANFIYEDPIFGEENKFLSVGFDRSGNLVEIIYEYIEDETIHVFHAMKCRKAVLKLFEK